MAAQASPNIDTVRELFGKVSNWNRWGDNDELGTLNFVTPERIAAGARLAKHGKAFSLSIPFGDNGPQRGGPRRFNPMHFMTRDGANAVAGTTVRDEYGGINPYTVGTDDVLILPTHSATHWDALAHITYDGKIYNGYAATEVAMRGARRGAIDRYRDRVLGRGVLLDVARATGKRWLEPGEAVSDEDLQGCANKEKVSVRPGDFLLIRTGQMAEVEARGAWGDYAGGKAPGLGLRSVPWLHAKEVAGVATDTWGAEVIPNETHDVFQPLHILLVMAMGLAVGEMFRLEELAEDCANDGVYEFFFFAAPLPITGGVGSPTNPMVVK